MNLDVISCVLMNLGTRASLRVRPCRGVRSGRGWLGLIQRTRRFTADPGLLFRRSPDASERMVGFSTLPGRMVGSGSMQSKTFEVQFVYEKDI